MKDFNTGFTNKSYFHIIKSIVEGVYERNFDIRKFDFNFRDDSSINACADYDKQGNYDILKINTGTIIEIVALMKTAFAQRNILSNFGNANEEKMQFIQESMYIRIINMNLSLVLRILLWIPVENNYRFM